MGFNAVLVGFVFLLLHQKMLLSVFSICIYFLVFVDFDDILVNTKMV